MMRNRAVKVLVLTAVSAFIALPALGQSPNYVYNFYNQDTSGHYNLIATYSGPLITNSIDYTFTIGFSLIAGAIPWVSDTSGGPAPSVPITALQPCFFVMSGTPGSTAAIFACRILKPNGEPQGTEIAVGFNGPLPSSPGTYEWDPYSPASTLSIIGGYITYFDGTNSWYAFSATGVNPISRLDITLPVPTYSCTGFAQPFNTTITLKPQVRRTIPLQAQLWNEDMLVTAATIAGGVAPVVAVSFTPVEGTGQGIIGELLGPGLAAAGNSFTFDPTTNMWSLNLGTSSFASPGTYTVTLKSGNAEQYQVSPTCTGTFVRK